MKESNQVLQLSPEKDTEERGSRISAGLPPSISSLAAVPPAPHELMRNRSQSTGGAVGGDVMTFGAGLEPAASMPAALPRTRHLSQPGTGLALQPAASLPTAAAAPENRQSTGGAAFPARPRTSAAVAAAALDAALHGPPKKTGWLSRSNSGQVVPVSGEAYATSAAAPGRVSNNALVIPVLGSPAAGGAAQEQPRRGGVQMIDKAEVLCLDGPTAPKRPPARPMTAAPSAADSERPSQKKIMSWVDDA